MLVQNFKDGDKKQKALLGGKGANLAEMKKMGLPVPGGFTITTEACGKYYEDNKELKDSLWNKIKTEMKDLEKETNKTFGKGPNPLLLSVRSGAAVSMPGMMDTVLNLGLNKETIEAMISINNNERFVYDSYRRFIQMFSDVVCGLERSEFEAILKKNKKEQKVDFDQDLDIETLKKIIVEMKDLFKKLTKEDFPEDVYEQLKRAVTAVFNSWDNERAIIYRNLNNIPHDIYTAVNIQAMVFGNMSEDSGTGVLFTRNPITGNKELYGEYLFNAQGEDVVAGIRTPHDISELSTVNKKLYDEIVSVANKLENHYKNMQDIEFTIELGQLFLLQTRTGKRAAKAAFKIACDMVKEKLMTKEEAIISIDTEKVEDLLHPIFDQAKIKSLELITKGVAAAPGTGIGQLCFDSKKAKALKDKGIDCILVREDTSPEDIEGMISARAIVTVTGGSTSHAAVVARGMGKCCVVGCNDIEVSATTLKVNGKTFKEGEIVSVDGSNGFIYLGKAEVIEPEQDENYFNIIEWSKNIKRLEIMANADTAEDVKTAIEFGAEGVGLCRTEHMFFDKVRINYIRQLIVTKDVEKRNNALSKLYEFQLADFENIYREAKELPVVIRLLDPPLHEFLPNNYETMVYVAESLQMPIEDLQKIAGEMEEVNPMLGHRGCRLAITSPEIYNMQARAIINAAANINKELKINIVPKIKLPLISNNKELLVIKEEIINEIDEIAKNNNIEYKVGTMIEVPRAAMVAHSIAGYCDFFSFGTNDLTQMTFGLSRDDSTALINTYLEKGILVDDPFKTIDVRGVGRLVDITTQEGRKRNKDLAIGVCGEHGGDPRSISFFEQIKLDYISCSPFRIVTAIISSAQAVINQK